MVMLESLYSKCSIIIIKVLMRQVPYFDYLKWDPILLTVLLIVINGRGFTVLWERPAPTPYLSMGTSFLCFHSSVISAVLPSQMVYYVSGSGEDEWAIFMNWGLVSVKHMYADKVNITKPKCFLVTHSNLCFLLQSSKCREKKPETSGVLPTSFLKSNFLSSSVSEYWHREMRLWILT